MRRLDSITDSMEVSLSKFWEMVKDREAWSAAVYGTVKSQTWLSNWTALSIMLQVTETLIVYLSIYFSCDIVSLKTYYEAQYVTTSFSFLNCPSRQAQKSLWWRKGRWRINPVAIPFKYIIDLFFLTRTISCVPISFLQYYLIRTFPFLKAW